MQKRSHIWIIYLACLIGIFLVMYFIPRSGTGQELSNTEYTTMLSQGKITEAVVNQNEAVPTGSVHFTTKDGTNGTVFVSDVSDAEKALSENHVKYTVKEVSNGSSIFSFIFPIILLIVAGIFLVNIIARSSMGGGSGSKMMNFSRSKAKMTVAGEQKKRFADVAGMEEEKEELVEVVDFLKTPAKYTSLGARIPKGVLLVGPPGTGKTLLAKAVAGEAGVPFFSISGSDFVEMFVGVGASRVRDLFDDAKKHHPCIVFIDEIDAVARRRGSGLGGGHDEREQTLNQLLVEMDGFGVNEGIIVMAATNRVDILDPAIRRPGRFDRTVAVGLPDVKGREEILRVHSKDKPLGDDVDLRQISQTTAGFSGADLENLLNEAAISAAKANRKYMIQADINAAFLKIGIGKEKKSRVISNKEKLITAYHESGHAILFHLLPDMDPVYTISIIPTGMAAGYTMPQPENDNLFMTKGKMLQRIMVGLGGRIAEELIFDDVTTGASQDILQVTAIARSMVTRFGMSERVGLIAYDDDSNEVFIGRDWGQTRNYSEEVAAVIDEEVQRIVSDCHKQATDMIVEHKAVLHECAKQLIEKEKLTRDEFEAIFDSLETGAAEVEEEAEAEEAEAAEAEEAEAEESEAEESEAAETEEGAAETAEASETEAAEAESDTDAPET